MSGKSGYDANNTKQSFPGLPWMGWGILALSATVSSAWSFHKLLEQDEVFSLQTDRVASFRQVVHIQQFYPISLEPPTYHVLAHAAMLLFGPTAFALRLPALAGYLLMQFCLFFFVRGLIQNEIVARRAGLLAMAIPAVTWTFFYSAEGRPYGLLLGTYAATALCWQLAARRGERGEPRFFLLSGLCVAIAITVTAHFYGVLLLIPLCGAELARTLWRTGTQTSTNDGQVDWPMVGAISAGIAALATTVPYIKASGEFKKHYYAGNVPYHMLTQPYRQMLMDYTSYPRLVQGVLEAMLLAGAVVVSWVIFQKYQKRTKRVSAATAGEWTLISLLLCLPLFAFVLGKFVTHALEARHSIGAIIAISVVIAIAASALLERDRYYAVIMSGTLVAIIVVNGLRIHTTAVEGRRLLEGLSLSRQTQDAIAANPDHNIYFQNLGEWETASLYEPDNELRKRLVLVYSRDEEMQREQHDTMYLTATHTMNFSNQPIVSYDTLRATLGEHVFAVYPSSGWDWTSSAFSQEAAQVTKIADGFGGTLVKVRFKQ